MTTANGCTRSVDRSIVTVDRSIVSGRADWQMFAEGTHGIKFILYAERENFIFYAILCTTSHSPASLGRADWTCRHRCLKLSE